MQPQDWRLNESVQFGDLELTRFLGHLTLMRRGGIRNAEIETTVPGGVQTARDGVVRVDNLIAKQVDPPTANTAPLIDGRNAGPLSSQRAARVEGWDPDLCLSGATEATPPRRDRGRYDSAGTQDYSSDGAARCPRWLRPPTGTSDSVRLGRSHARPHRPADHARSCPTFSNSARSWTL